MNPLQNELSGIFLINPACTNELNFIITHKDARPDNHRHETNCLYNEPGTTIMPYSAQKAQQIAPDTIAIIPITGTMFKYDSWYSEGMDSVADRLLIADNTANITATILLINSPGGSVHSLIRLEDALRRRRKPCVALVDGMCASAALYVASLCDKIFSINPMCEIGSIGTYIQILDFSQAYKKEGIKIIDIYPPESSHKNREYREALNGNTQPMIQNSLTPWALHFQNLIKKNRPHIDTSAEGILQGALFYAQDALKYKLIDGIYNLQDTVKITKQLIKQKNELSNLF